MLGETEKDIKKVEFLNSIIKEKAAIISQTEKDLASARKKNGKGVDLDIFIYQANMKIAACKKEIEVCKKEIKALREKIGERLISLYADNRAYVNRLYFKETFAKVYEGKAAIVDETEEKEVLAVFGVSTKDKKLDGTSVLLLKAGIRTPMGKVIKKPEIAVYEYSKKRTDGEKIEDGYPKDVTLGEKKKSLLRRIFKK